MRLLICCSKYLPSSVSKHSWCPRHRLPAHSNPRVTCVYSGGHTWLLLTIVDYCLTALSQFQVSSWRSHRWCQLGYWVKDVIDLVFHIKTPIEPNMCGLLHTDSIHAKGPDQASVCLKLYLRLPHCILLACGIGWRWNTCPTGRLRSVTDVGEVPVLFLLSCSVTFRKDIHP